MNRLKLHIKPFWTIGLILTLLFLGNLVFAQQPRIYNGFRWQEIESAIKSGKLLRETLNKVNHGKLAAIENGDEISEARCYYYQVLIKDKLNEDSLYFRNSAFIDSLLANPATKPVLKSLLHLMQARRILAFNIKNLKFKTSTYETRNLKYNYAALTKVQQDSVVLYHWNLATSIATTNPIRSYDLLWLSSTSAVFLFEPSQRDIAITEKIYNQVFRNMYMDIGKEQTNAKIISYPSNQFIAAIDSLSASKADDAKVLASYKEWMDTYRHDPEKYTYIQTCIRKYFYTRNVEDSTMISNYEYYLLQQTSSTYNTVRAAAAFQLFNIYLDQGRKYSNGFNPAYSAYFKKALKVYEDNKSSLDAFEGFRTRLLVLLNTIKGQELELTLENIHIPNRPVLLQAKYQNVPFLYYRVVKMSNSKDLLVPKEQRYNHLYKRTALVTDSIKLPDPGDYNTHAVYLKLEPLPIGKYYLLFSAVRLSQDTEAPAIPFVVSNISAIDDGKQLIVLNRKTGHPLRDVKATVNYAAYKNGRRLINALTKEYGANDHGVIKPDQRNPKQLLLIQGQDTLDYNFQLREQSSAKYLFDKEEYDDLEEFYDDHAKVMVYTDRAIYRPGQKVYFKAVLFSRNPETGEQIIFNKDAGKAFRAWLKNNSPKLDLVDASITTVDSVTMVPDGFGSFSGSFTLPKTAVTGDWQIEGDHVDEFYRSGRFSVEEYKRPTLEMKLESPTIQPLPGHPFELKLKVNSLSGALLNNIQIKYQLVRSNQDPKVLPVNRGYQNRQLSLKLIDTIAFTNNKGELTINVVDTALHLNDFNPDKQWHFNYTINALAIETSGEQLELRDNYNISAWPVNISVKIASFYEKAKLPMLSPEVKTGGIKVTATPLNVAVYRIGEIDNPIGDREIDQWMYSLQQLRSWFPGVDFKLTNSEKETKELVFSNLLDSVNQQIDLSKVNLADGEYELVITAKREGRTAGKFVNRFRVFDHHAAHSNNVPFSHLPDNFFKIGDSVTYYINVPDSAYVVYGLTYCSSKLKKPIKDICKGIAEKGGLVKFQFKVPEDAIENLFLNVIYIRNNKVYDKREEIYLYKPLKLSPEIIVEKYRKVLVPGAKEKFSVSVKTKDKNVAMQLMTTIYDAALDKLKEHTWQRPNDERPFERTYDYWNSNISQLTKDRISHKHKNTQQDIFADELNGYQYGLYNHLAGIANAMEITTLPKQRATGSFVRLRGTTTITDYTQPLTIIDGVIYTGQLADFNSALITEAMVLKGADASGLYGSRAAQGVLIISTKGKIILPGSEEAPVVKVRKNFNETAVFIPSIYADKDGLYTFSFTMPESATEWNWKMLAHTKEGVFAYAERKLHTRLNLMVQPHMPRLLYQGDELNLQSRITNMDSLSITGKASCKIEDAVTGEDLTGVINTGSDSSFSLAGKSNGYTAFKLKVPATQVNPLKMVITAVAGNVADAEEHIIPVMSRQIFVKESMPLRFSARDTVVKSRKLPDDALLYGIGLSMDPKPQVALINALPWLANYSYDCAEQTFNKMLANVTALDIMRNDKNAQAIFTMAKQAEISTTNSGNKAAELPDDITKVVTPWLKLDAQQATQQKQLLALLDTLKTKDQIDKYLQKIYELQNPDGGIPWFTGGKSNAYISNYLLAGFGKLNAGSWKKNDNVYQDFIRKLKVFCDKGYKDTDVLYYAYARSFWPQALPIDIKAELRVRLADSWKPAFQGSLRSRLLGILSVMRLFSADDPLYAKAKADMESIRQMAISDPQNGMRWKEIADQDNLDVNTEEMIELLSMVFAGDKAAVKGMLQWLLSTRAEQRWATTTGTAATINLLMKENGSAVAVPQSLTAILEERKLSVSDDLLNSRLMDFSKVTKTELVNELKTALLIKLSKADAIPAKGNFSWYYFTGAQNLNRLNTSVKLDKSLFVFSDERKKWIAADKGLVFKIGTRVKVVLSIETQKQLTFVQLDDYRAAAFEPAEQKSGHQYQDRISYYQSIRDTGYQIFTEFIPSGKSELSYELKVVQEGSFANGPAVLSCMYKPEIAAYSNSFVIKTIK